MTLVTSTRRFRSLVVLVLSVALMAAACSGEQAENTQAQPEAADASTGDLLSNADVSSKDPEELDAIRFDGIDLSADLGQLELQMVAGDLEPMDLLMFVDDTGLLAIAPFHPVSPGEGGPVTLRLSAGTEIKEFDLDLQGIPEAPGAWDGAVASLLDELEARAGQLGTTLDEIAQSPLRDLEPDAAMIHVLAGILDDGTDQDLGSLPSRPGQQLSDEQAALLDATVAKIGLGTINLPPLDAASSSALGAAAEVVSPGISPSATAMRATLAQGSSCQRKVIPIHDGGDLQEALARGIDAQNALKDGYFSDRADKYVSTLLMVTGVSAGIAAASGVGAPAAGVVAGVSTAAGAMYATQRLALMADAGNYPSSFRSLEVDVNQDEFNEDFIKDGEITKIEVVAASTGFNASEALAGLGAAVADAALGLGAGKLVAPNSRASDVLSGTMGMSEPVRQTGMGMALDAAAGDLLEFCAQTWTVPIKSNRYVRAWTTEDRISVDDVLFTLRPTDLGEDLMWVETSPEAFPGASAITSVPLSVARLDVTASPTEIELERAGTVVTVTAMLENADTHKLDWHTEQGSWVDDLGTQTDSVEVVRQLETPKNPDLYPFTVTITSRSDTGLRKDATDERSASVTIDIADIIVSPDPGVVLVKKQRQFIAQDTNGNTVDVTWSATGGTIDSNGLYTAFDEQGAFTVTATAKDDKNATDTATVNVVDDCVVGTWLLRSQDFFDQINAIAGGAGDAETIYRAGEHRLVIREDGTFVGIRDAWELEVSTPAGKVVVIIDAENPGTWIATDSDILIEELGGGSEDVQLLIEVGGNLVSVPGLDMDFSFTSEAYSAQATYTCDASVMTSTADGITSTFDRIGE